MTNTTSNIFSRIKSATVAIALLNEGNQRNPFLIIGSGFCIHEEGIVVSCKHVISATLDKEELEQILTLESSSDKEKGLIREIKGHIPHVIFFETSRKGNLTAYPVEIEHSILKMNYDLGLIKLRKHKVFSKGFPILTIENYDNIHEGLDIGLCGFPLGNYLQDQIGTITSSFTKGILSSIIPSPSTTLEFLKGFQLNITATHGNSGGPVFLMETGSVFGVLQRGIYGQDGALLQGLAKAEPIYVLTEDDTIDRLLKSSYKDFE